MAYLRFLETKKICAFGKQAGENLVQPTFDGSA
jgi:hypothetical protein